jgi:hypothetical protein
MKNQYHGNYAKTPGAWLGEVMDTGAMEDYWREHRKITVTL